MDTRTLCLGILGDGDATGYEIKKFVEERFGHFLEVSQSAIYPALGELRREGLVSCCEVRQEGRPDKKVYSLTDAGQAALLEGLARSPGRHRVRSEFIALLLFARWLPAERVTQLLDEREADFARVLEYLRTCADQADAPGARFVGGLGEAMLSAGLAYIREHRDELETALAEADGTREAAP